MWGNRTTILAAALGAASSRRPTNSTSKFDFFDTELTLNKRLRAAKARRSSIPWWEEQFSAATSVSITNRLILFMALFVFADPAVILECERFVAQPLDALATDDWESVCEVVSTLVEVQVDRTARAAQSHSPHESSLRMSYLLALKAPKTFGRSAFIKHFLHNGDQNQRYLDFRQSWSLRSAVEGALDWEIALETVKQTYAAGAEDTYFVLQYPNLRLPEDVAAKILANPTEYPAALWDVAQNVASSIARKTVRAVGSVARAEKWF